MKNNNKNLMTMGLLLGFAGLLSLYISFKDFKQSDTVRIKDFPRTLGVWTSEEIPLSPQELAILETDNAFVRKYTNPNGEAVYLYIVYSQTNHKASHPPEICYIGGGVSINEKTLDPIPISYRNLVINANRMLLQDNNLYQIAYYWFKAGDTFTASYWKQQAMIAFNTLLGRKEGSALIRISADITHHNTDKAIEEVKEFTNLSAPFLFKYLP